MPKNIQKSVQGYVSKIKKQAPRLRFSHSSISTATSKIISGCKHPKSLSFAIDRKGGKSQEQQHHNDEAAATLEDIDRFLIENFKSLYVQEQDHETHDDDDNDITHEKAKGKGISTHNGPTLKEGGTSSDSPRFFTPCRDLYESNRFFISPTSSGSLLEEVVLSGVGTSSTSDDGGSSSPFMSETRTPSREQVKDDVSAIPRGVEDCIAILRVSPSPYDDFKRSMQEMLEARIQHDQKVDWEFMEELLFCYLRLNEKTQYRYILSAFVDLIVILRQNPCNGGPEGSRSSDEENNNNNVKGKKRGDFY